MTPAPPLSLSSLSLQPQPGGARPRPWCQNWRSWVTWGLTSTLSTYWQRAPNMVRRGTSCSRTSTRITIVDMSSLCINSTWTVSERNSVSASTWFYYIIITALYLIAFESLFYILTDTFFVQTDNNQVFQYVFICLPFIFLHFCFQSCYQYFGGCAGIRHLLAEHLKICVFRNIYASLSDIEKKNVIFYFCFYFFI